MSKTSRIEIKYEEKKVTTTNKKAVIRLPFFQMGRWDDGTIWISYFRLCKKAMDPYTIAESVAYYNKETKKASINYEYDFHNGSSAIGHYKKRNKVVTKGMFDEIAREAMKQKKDKFMGEIKSLCEYIDLEME